METKFFLPYQCRWIDDTSGLRIIEKARQIGLTTADAYDSVLKAGATDSKLDVWVSSRDLRTAREYLRQCKYWAQTLQLPTADPEWEIFDKARDLGAFALRFKTGRCIFSLSSSPDALVGKTGHIKLDEFAVHRDQRELYRIAKPCTTWGGQLSIISTHRGDQTVFYEILQSIKHSGNPMGWSHHRVTLQDAVDAGLVERINEVTGHSQTREEFLRRLRAECLDEEQWLQEYCCVPADDNAAFITHEMITQCEEEGCLQSFEELAMTANELFAGVDIARKEHLCVIDVAERIGDVLWDRLRIELKNATFDEMEQELFGLLELPQLRRACIDATGLGMQLAERAKRQFGWKAEPVTFTASLKEQLAYALRTALEQRRVRLDPDPKLRADLRSIRKEITAAGNFRFGGETKDSHCDRFWAKALRQHAADRRAKVGAMVC
jgi:phage FluMu gp28-like protein